MGTTVCRASELHQGRWYYDCDDFSGPLSIFNPVSIVYKKIFFTPKVNKIVKSYAIFTPLPSPFEMNAVALVYFFRSHW